MIPIAALVDLKIDKSQEIYTDLLSNEFGTPPVQRYIWGAYNRKPAAQMDFDHLIIKACQEIAANDSSDIQAHDFRPMIKDLNSGLFFLIDTGAATSVFPKSDDHKVPMDEKTGLQAVNGTKIPTYGKKLVKLRFNKKTFEHTMTVAKIQQPIIGWDLLMAFRFDLMWTNSQCVLFCNKTKSSYPLSLGRVERSNLNLAPVEISFKRIFAF